MSSVRKTNAAASMESVESQSRNNADLVVVSENQGGNPTGKNNTDHMAAHTSKSTSSTGHATTSETNLLSAAGASNVEGVAKTGTGTVRSGQYAGSNASNYSSNTDAGRGGTVSIAPSTAGAHIQKGNVSQVSGQSGTTGMQNANVVRNVRVGTSNVSSNMNIQRQNVAGGQPSSSSVNMANGSSMNTVSKNISGTTVSTVNSSNAISGPASVKWGQAFASFTGDATKCTLSFEKGAYLQLFKEHNTGWFTAKLGDKVGYAPTNYINIIDRPPASVLASVQLSTAGSMGMKRKREAGGMDTSVSRARVAGSGAVGMSGKVDSSGFVVNGHATHNSNSGVAMAGSGQHVTGAQYMTNGNASTGNQGYGYSEVVGNVKYGNSGAVSHHGSQSTTSTQSLQPSGPVFFDPNKLQSELEASTVPQLKDYLKHYGLKRTGLKQELVERLHSHLLQQQRHQQIQQQQQQQQQQRQSSVQPQVQPHNQSMAHARTPHNVQPGAHNASSRTQVTTSTITRHLHWRLPSPIHLTAKVPSAPPYTTLSVTPIDIVALSDKLASATELRLTSSFLTENFAVYYQKHHTAFGDFDHSFYFLAKQPVSLTLTNHRNLYHYDMNYIWECSPECGLCGGPAETFPYDEASKPENPMLQFICEFLEPEKLARPQFPPDISRWDWQHSVTRVCRCGHISITMCETKNPQGAGPLGMMRQLFGPSTFDEDPEGKKTTSTSPSSAVGKSHNSNATNVKPAPSTVSSKMGTAGSQSSTVVSSSTTPSSTSQTSGKNLSSTTMHATSNQVSSTATANAR